MKMPIANERLEEHITCRCGNYCKSFTLLSWAMEWWTTYWLSSLLQPFLFDVKRIISYCTI